MAVSLRRISVLVLLAVGLVVATPFALVFVGVALAAVALFVVVLSAVALVVGVAVAIAPIALAPVAIAFGDVVLVAVCSVAMAIFRPRRRTPSPEVSRASVEGAANPLALPAAQTLVSDYHVDRGRQVA